MRARASHVALVAAAGSCGVAALALSWFLQRLDRR